MKQLIAAVTAVVCLALQARAEVPSYQIQFLGAGWTGTGINQSGDVCGSGTPDGSLTRAGISRGGAPFEPLPLPPGMQTSRAHDINDAGWIVGSVCPNQYIQTQPIPAVWRPTVGGGYEAEVLEVLPGDLYGGAYAVNNLGDIVGATGFWGWNPDHGVQFTSEGPVALPEDMLGVDVNEQRVVVTSNRLLDLDTGIVTTIPLPEGIWQGMASAALNDNNDFSGYIAGNSSCSIFPIRYRQGIGWEFLGGCAPSAASANALNNRGDALQYYYTTASGVTFADEGYFMLGSLIAPDQGEYYIQWGGANGINDARQIVAAARQGFSGPIGAILMTPLTTSADDSATAAWTSVQIVPNPSNGEVHLDGPIEALQGIEWAVFDLGGRRLASFAGRSWDGQNQAGERVPAGVYFVRPAQQSAGPSLRLVRR